MGYAVIYQYQSTQLTLDIAEGITAEALLQWAEKYPVKIYGIMFPYSFIAVVPVWWILSPL